MSTSATPATAVSRLAGRSEAHGSVRGALHVAGFISQSLVPCTAFVYTRAFSGGCSLDVISILDSQAIFFDFDGVILESLDIKAEAFVSLYADAGEDTRRGVTEHFYRRTGISRQVKIRECHRKFLGREPSDEEVAALAERFRARIDEGMLVCPAVPGALELLSVLPKALIRFVVSGTPQNELRSQIASRGLTRYFTSVHGSPETKVEIIETLKSRHDIDPAQAVMIGDGLVDLEAARDTGLRFIGRVPEGRESPFPAQVETMPDLTHLTAPVR